MHRTEEYVRASLAAAQGHAEEAVEIATAGLLDAPGEMELFLPLIVLLAPGAVLPGAPSWVVAATIVWVLALLLVVTMFLSDIINNAATVLVMAPIAVSLSQALQVNTDPLLMAVAVGASCAFLTPIGHKNNTLILGPGGYRFGDYWRMGLPLELLVILVAVPMILWVWPF